MKRLMAIMGAVAALLLSPAVSAKDYKAVFVGSVATGSLMGSDVTLEFAFSDASSGGTVSNPDAFSTMFKDTAGTSRLTIGDTTYEMAGAFVSTTRKNDAFEGFVLPDSVNFAWQTSDGMNRWDATISGQGDFLGSQDVFAPIATGGIDAATGRFSLFGISGGQQDFDFKSMTFTITDTAISDIPEPATWLMLALGFGGMGALLRRKRAMANPAFA